MHQTEIARRALEHENKRKALKASLACKMNPIPEVPGTGKTGDGEQSGAPTVLARVEEEYRAAKLATHRKNNAMLNNHDAMRLLLLDWHELEWPKHDKVPDRLPLDYVPPEKAPLRNLKRKTGQSQRSQEEPPNKVVAIQPLRRSGRSRVTRSPNSWKTQR